MSLRLVAVSKIYAQRQGRTERALWQVSLTLAPGERVALIGASGAGKSTLLRCINRLVTPTAGQIFLNDVEITALNAKALRQMRRQLGMVFQEFALVERLSVMENVLAGALGSVDFWPSLFRRFPQVIVDRAFFLLDRVGLADYIDKRVDSLSGGQRQRVGIARALLQAPQVLLVDEPTASLDPRTSVQIMQLLMEIAEEQQVAMLVNLHDLPLAQRFFKRLVGLKKGEIVFDGDAQALQQGQLNQIYGREVLAA